MDACIFTVWCIYKYQISGLQVTDAFVVVMPFGRDETAIIYLAKEPLSAPHGFDIEAVTVRDILVSILWNSTYTQCIVVVVFGEPQLCAVLFCPAAG